MKTPIRCADGPKARWLLWTLAGAAGLVCIVLWWKGSGRLLENQEPAPAVQATRGPSSNAVSDTILSATTSPTTGFVSRPFPVAQESARFQWTAADGRDTNVIRQLAHNSLEYDRMVEENARILRRQLVYLKETAAAVMEQSRADGGPVRQLTLPGLDGRELPFEIRRSDLEPSKLAGTFTGQLPGRPNSMVTLSFKFGREAFTIVSPDDGLYLQAWPRDPGQVILTSFDPETYLPLPGGDPIKTTNLFKTAQ
jgi:hypothetical protein